MNSVSDLGPVANVTPPVRAPDNPSRERTVEQVEQSDSSRPEQREDFFVASDAALRLVQKATSEVSRSLDDRQTQPQTPRTPGHFVDLYA